MKMNNDDMAMLGENENIMIIRNSDDMEWVGDDGKKMKRVMIRGERFGKGPDTSKYMDDIPELLFVELKKAMKKVLILKLTQ